MTSNFDFSETSRRDVLDLDELLFVSGNVDVRHAKTFGGKNANTVAFHLVGIVVGVVRQVAVAQVVPEREDKNCY